MDELSAESILGKLPPTQFTQETVSMHFYNSIVAFERGRYVDTKSVMTGATQEY